MTEQQIKDAKERILDAAISLFAQKGHAAVGVREIARVANVNISMISYYYEGKIGILKAIIERFHDSYFQVWQRLKHLFRLFKVGCHPYKDPGTRVPEYVVEFMAPVKKIDGYDDRPSFSKGIIGEDEFRA